MGGIAHLKRARGERGGGKTPAKIEAGN